MADLVPVEIDEDYYGVLNVPRTVGLAGLQAAYARLSDDLAARMAVDPTAREELIRLNRAFGVLGNSDLRERYDARHFAGETDPVVEAVEIHERRSRLASNLLFGALIVVVAVQVAVIGYFGRTEFADAFGAVLGIFSPSGAS